MLLLVLSEHLLSGFMVGSAITRLVQSFSVVFLYWFYVFSYATIETMSSGTSYWSSQGTRSYRSNEDDLDLQAQMEKRRKRRKESNRESARRSRVRKQQHLDDLSSQVNQLENQNQQLSTALGMNIQNLVAVQAQNSVLQTQKMELERRLRALSEIICCMNSVTNTTNPATMGITASSTACDIFGTSTWSQPIDLYQCF